MSIIEDLTALYGPPTVSRGISRWHVSCPGLVSVSIVHGPGIYCGNTSVEVAYLGSRDILLPGSVTTDPTVLDLFGGNTVAGWCTLEDVQKIVAAAQ